MAPDAFPPHLAPAFRAEAKHILHAKNKNDMGQASWVVGTYYRHDDATEAVGKLQESGIDIGEKASIVGRGELVEDHLEIHTATDALRSTTFFGILAGAGAGLLVAFQGAAYSTETILSGLSIGALAGAAVGMVRAVMVGPKGKLHLHKHWKLDSYEVRLHDCTEEDVRRARALLGYAPRPETVA
jgi:hypothetical protein